jgi:hypothetical protein
MPLKLSRKPKIQLIKIAVHGLPPILISLIFYSMSPNQISRVQLAMAYVLLQMPWSAYLNWKERSDEKIPVFALISAMYWVYYALSLFWGTRTTSGVETLIEKNVPDEAITWSLALAVTGVSAIWLGMRSRLGMYLLPKKLPELKPGLGSIHYIRLLMVTGTLLSLSEGIPYLAGEGGRQALTILTSLVPILAFAILFRKVLSGEAGQVDKLLVVCFLALRLVIGLSSGWLGAFASIILVCAAVYVAEKRTIPRLAFVLVVLFTLFFQVGKQEFREAYWTTSTTAVSKIDRVKFWTETSFKKWQEALSDPTGRGLGDAMNQSMSRVSLLTQTANVVDLTPATVPYQGGQLYYYLLITWIPRALWPDKPSVNDANRFYQVAYAMTSEEDLDKVAIAVGAMTEAYISFGWFGVLGIMFLIGVLYDFYRRVFFSHNSGLLMVGLGLALLPQLINIESQMAVYLGGIVQQVIFTLLIFSPVIRWRSPQSKLDFSLLSPPVRTDVRTIP